MAEEEELNLDEEDTANTKQVISDLIDVIVKFNASDKITEAHYAELKTVLDFATFVIDGVIYSNGIDLCADHDHGDEKNEQ